MKLFTKCNENLQVDELHQHPHQVVLVVVVVIGCVVDVRVPFHDILLRVIDRDVALIEISFKVIDRVVVYLDVSLCVAKLLPLT
jgi:uncharacterized protein YqhQ